MTKSNIMIYPPIGEPIEFKAVERFDIVGYCLSFRPLGHKYMVTTNLPFYVQEFPNGTVIP